MHTDDHNMVKPLGITFNIENIKLVFYLHCTFKSVRHQKCFFEEF